ncbi:hypothetical protein [Antrihabitans sp. YC2-6]|uniref:hypothetical protein n=1 Tax=Antrihabitans sp. YC2-6 TaxID=2799498 RepID=UPI0018F6BDE2|nr:hypothetical protein [Antrihabitans sp. YC2-6]MBJ8346495.1 hypothetical protein [Antrihabitans sp. YC2-6]
MGSKDDAHEANANADDLVEVDATTETEQKTSLAKPSKQDPDPAPAAETTAAETTAAETTAADAPDAAAAETADSTEPAAPTGARQAPVWAVAALGGVLVVLLIGMFINWNPWFGPEKGLPVFSGKAGRLLDDQQADKDAARDAGCDIATKLLTYDYNNVDEFFDNVRQVTTGTFGRGFAADSAALRDMFMQGQVTSRPENVECEVVMSGDETTRVLVTATQMSSSIDTQGKEQSEQAELYVDLEKVDGRWLAGDLSPVKSASGQQPGGVPGSQPGVDPNAGQQPPATEGQPAPGEAPAPEAPPAP